MNNTLLKEAYLALSLAVAALSGWLTVSFMFSIGQMVGAPFTTAAIGGVLDVTKCISPAFVLLFLSETSLWVFPVCVVAESFVKPGLFCCIRCFTRIVLTELKETGLLRPYRNGYALAI